MNLTDGNSAGVTVPDWTVLVPSIGGASIGAVVLGACLWAVRQAYAGRDLRVVCGWGPFRWSMDVDANRDGQITTPAVLRLNNVLQTPPPTPVPSLGMIAPLPGASTLSPATSPTHAEHVATGVPTTAPPSD